MASDQSRTVYCGNVSPKVTEELLYELFLQAGPLENICVPKDKNGEQRRFAFVTFRHECSVDYSIFLFQGTILFEEELQLKRRDGAAPQRNNPPPIMYQQPFQQIPNFHFQTPYPQQFSQFYPQPNMFMNPITAGAPMYIQPMRTMTEDNSQRYGNIDKGMVSGQSNHRQEYSSSRNNYDSRRDYQKDYSSHRSSHDYEREYKRPRYSDSDYQDRTGSYERRSNDRYTERSSHKYY